MEFLDLVKLLSRWIHIASAVTLLGGVVFARWVLAGSGHGALVARYGMALKAASLGLLASGIYNLLSKAAVPKGYHAIFGIKFLLALHVFAIATMLGNASVDDAKRTRWMTGIVVSGGLILALSAYLRYLTTN